MDISNRNFQKRVLPRKQQQNCCPATGMVQIVATMVNCAEIILQLSATDPPLSRRMMHANYPGQTAWPRCEQHPSTDQFVSCCGLMKQSAMVHKRPPAAGDSSGAAASERLHVASIYRQIAEELGVREQQVEATV